MNVTTGGPGGRRQDDERQEDAGRTALIELVERDQAPAGNDARIGIR